jgi:hypothetical protein
VKEAFERGFIDELDMSFRNFEDDLRRAESDSLEEWQRKEFEPFGEFIEEFSHWAGFKPKEARDEAGWLPSWSATPAHNPFRDVGRNDPCPCGSGKKFKKCCLGKSTRDPRAVLSADTPFFNSSDEIADATIDEYNPLVAPDPLTWLAIDEQDRIDMIALYHRSHGFPGDRVMAHATFHAAVENQLAMDDQMPVRRTLARLMAEGLDRHDAIHAIGFVFADHINELMRDKSPSASWNEAGYFSDLEQLTATKWLNSN